MSRRLKVLVTRRWPETVEQRISERYDATLNQHDIPLTNEQLMSAMQEYDVICPTITDSLHADIINVAERRVKLIANYGAGFEHIDLKAANAAGVTVTNTPDVLTEATADLAITLMLMASRRASEGERELRAGKWSGWHPTHMRGRSLRNKTLGLVGFGRIAQAVAETAHFGFGMKIVYFSRNPATGETVRRVNAQYVNSLSSMASQSDFMSLHIPGGAETRHIIDADVLSHMPSHAILINTARGDVVHEDALIDALESGQIAGAALDVFAGEPHISERLLNAPNTVLLPHLGSATHETRDAMGLCALANLKDWSEGNTPQNKL